MFVSQASAACAQAAGAPQAQSGAQLQEIVVTARRRQESLQRVPVAVSVVSGEQLKNNLATDLSGVGELAPQVTMAPAGQGTGAVLTVRGVSSDTSDPGLDQSVSLDIDGVPISRGQVITTSVFDMHQVQVLEGPQALFFGKNSPAGVIVLRSNDPTDHFEGYLTGGYEFVAKERYAEGAVSGPLTDTLKARLAFRVDQMDGWIKNVAGPVQDFVNPSVTDPGAIQGNTSPAGHDYAARLTLQWTPTNDFDAKFKLLMDSKRNNGADGSSEPFCINGQTQPVLVGVLPLPGADCAKNMVKSESAPAAQYTANTPYTNGGVPYFWSQFALASLTLNKELDNLTLTSTTGYYHQTVETMYTSDWSPYASIWAASKESYHLITQELRANTKLDGPVNFMGGLYFEHFDRPYFNAPDLFHTFNPIANNYTAVNLLSNTEGSSYSAFGQVRWNIIPTVELAAGARYSHDDKNFSMVNLANNYPGLYPAGQVLSTKYTGDNLSPEATLSWHPKHDQTLYAAYKTGYKAGGVSNAFLMPSTATPENITFQPEKVRGVEVGYKATAFDRSLRFDLTAYRYNYRNLQVVSYDATTISFTTQNAASARIQGLEGSAEWAATNDLTFHGNFGWNSAKYLSFTTAPCYVGQPVAPGACTALGTQDLSGKALNRAPKLTYTLGGEYRARVAPEWSAHFNLQGRYSSSYQTATDYGPGGLQPAFWLLNASARIGPDDGRYELALIGRNLTNSYYMVESVGWSGSENPNQYVGFFNRPREVVLQGTVRW